MSRTKIEWATDVWNPVRGCSRVSEGCRHCYAERQANRFWPEFAANGRWTGRVELLPDKLGDPLRWRKPRARVFVNSISDLFHEQLSNADIAAVFGVMAACQQHTFLVLTKRPKRMLDLFKWCRANAVHGCEKNSYPPEDWPFAVCMALRYEALVRNVNVGMGEQWPLPNVWLGVSVEDQKTADERMQTFMSTPAALRFVSYEPALGPVDFEPWMFPPPEEGGIDWIIAGGESGPGARPAHPDWFRRVRDDCEAASVPFFFKQWGEFVHRSALTDEQHREIDDAVNLAGNTAEFFGLGKTRAGRTLDGREHDEVPV